MLEDTEGVYIDKKDGEYSLASGMLSMTGVMSGMNETDDTPYIRGEFLRKHNVPDPKYKGDEWVGHGKF